MPYNSIITRSEAAALIPEDVSREVIQGIAESSAITRLATRLPDMPRAQRRMPVLGSMPTAYFVTGDTGLKQTSEVSWANKYLDAEEIACIVPIPEAVLGDADYDIWAQIRPLMSAEFGRVFDAAVLFGTNAPAAWPNDIVTAAVAAGNSVDLSTQIAAGDDLYDIIMGENGVIAKVEADGFLVTGHIGALGMRGKLRGLREKIWNGTALVNGGAPVFNKSVQDPTRYELDGSFMEFPRNGAWNATIAQMVSGDFSQLVYSFRNDITFKILDQAVIQDGTGAIVYNLAQQDMVALRAVMRIAWQVPNPINAVEAVEANRYPFSVLVP